MLALAAGVCIGAHVTPSHMLPLPEFPAAVTLLVLFSALHECDIHIHRLQLQRLHTDNFYLFYLICSSGLSQKYKSIKKATLCTL